MPGLLAVVLLVVPLVELWFILQVAERIGILETVLSLIVVAVLGTWLLVREGRATWMRLRSTMARGEIPTTELTEGAAILVGGALLLTPGFLTDVVGLLLVFPVTRVIATRGLRRAFGWWIGGRFGKAGRVGKVVYDASVTNVRRKGATPDPPGSSARTLPSSQHPSDEDGSPDKG